MMAITDYPRCAAYLKGMRCRLDDPEMTDYWWAVVLSEKWTDEELVSDGRVNFAAMDGSAILTEFERLLRDGRQKSRSISNEDMARLTAFLGSRGVKTSALSSAEEYWTVAAIMWPSAIKKHDGGTFDELLAILNRMTKRQRAEARTTILNVPAKWLGGGRA